MNLLRGLTTIPPVALLLVILALPSADAVTLDWVTVGNPGNANDTINTGTNPNYGAVAHEYRIMKFEFTNSQYTAFLNAIDPDGTNPNAVYSSLMGGDGRGGITNTGTTNGSRYAAKPNMGDKPVNFVSWWDAARVCNWLHNGAKTCDKADSSASGPQNTGAYTVGTATSGDTVAANPGALFRVPTANEWYKAAHYDPTLNGNAGGYHVFGNGFDTTPGIISADASGVGSAGGVGNFANYHSKADWNGQDGNVTTVGTNGGPSYYGAFDMSGNVYEWNDLTGAVGPSRGLRGGGWVNSAPNVTSSGHGTHDTAREGNSGGFRLASPVSEPATPGTGKSSPGPEVLENSIGIKLRLLPAGTFTMGRPGGDTDETPHRVTLTKPFYMGVHEVTNAQWKRVMGSVRSNWKDDDHPVEQVSWQDALEFCQKLSALPEERSAGRAYRLPSEAEWEYACRAGTNTTYSFGDDASQLGEHGWYDGNAGSQTHPVGQKKANAWGLHDMHGNVWELCGDFYGGYPEGASTDPQGPSGTSDRVRRGGCWGSAAGICRSAFRGWLDPSYRQNSLGFRLALSPSSEGKPVPPEATAEPAPGVLENSIGIKLKLLPAGTFTMGQPGGGPDETPHQVTLTKPFYIGLHEVTNAQWKQVMGSVEQPPWWPLGSVPSHWRDDDRPVEKLMALHAEEFCKKLSALPEERKAGRVYRLPTEAEWEYACRAGTDTKYSFGDDESQLGEHGWYDGNAGSQTHPVGQKKANAWGLYDMHGNVWEWCSDMYGVYPEGASTDPQGTSKGDGRAIRGGCWGNAAAYCRSAYRYGYAVHSRYNFVGFRVALSPPEVKPVPPEAAK